MSYTKQTNIMQYTEIVYYRDTEEIGRERQHDDSLYETVFKTPMTEEEIEDWA